MEFRADLHCHSFFSDGSDSPSDLILLAKKSGLSGLSITDHDTILAYESALAFAEKENILLLPGVEFSSFYGNEPVHILGYGFSLQSLSILELCLRHKERRRKRNLAILENLNKLGIQIDEEELQDPSRPDKSIGRPKIAEIMVEKKVVSSLVEAFNKYLAEGKRAYAAGAAFSVHETIEAIHEGGGLAIIAHPHLIKRSRVAKELLNLPFDGLEGFYARLDPVREQKWIDAANRKQWLITGGSDYHGKNKPLSRLGSSWVTAETFDKLYSHYLSV